MCCEPILKYASLFLNMLRFLDWESEDCVMLFSLLKSKTDQTLEIVYLCQGWRKESKIGPTT